MKVDANGFIYVLGYERRQGRFPDDTGRLPAAARRTSRPTASTRGLLHQQVQPRRLGARSTRRSSAGPATRRRGPSRQARSTSMPRAVSTSSATRSRLTSRSRPTPPTRPSRSTVGNVQADAFYARLNADGSLGYSTYIGGTRREAATGVDVDAAGNAYVVGKTASNTTTDGFVITPNAYRVDPLGWRRSLRAAVLADRRPASTRRTSAAARAT